MKSLVISPHPDDEVLGVGGTLLKRKKNGNDIAWLIVTKISEAHGWEKKQIDLRKDEIKKVSKFFGFSNVYQLNFPTTKLDTIPKSILVKNISDVFKAFKPYEIFVPHLSDVHSDHKVISDIISTCTKNFRYPFIKRILAYETISETEYNLNNSIKFKPNYFEDITNFLSKKIKVMNIYKSEISKFPFPRSNVSIDAQSKWRGTFVGVEAAEAFELLKQISK